MPPRLPVSPEDGHWMLVNSAPLERSHCRKERSAAEGTDIYDWCIGWVAEVKGFGEEIDEIGEWIMI